jgi:hypothetical protein
VTWCKADGRTPTSRRHPRRDGDHQPHRGWWSPSPVGVTPSPALKRVIPEYGSSLEIAGTPTPGSAFMMLLCQVDRDGVI